LLKRLDRSLTRVARCHIFKNPNLGKFEKMEDVGLFYSHLVVYFTAIWSILRPFGLFYGHLVYFMTIWYIFAVLVCFAKKNLAALAVTGSTVCELGGPPSIMFRLRLPWLL
jgi:hypothetical protein